MADGPRVMVVEDDRAMREGLVRLLALQGFEPRVCADFSTAAQEALAAQADCALVDLRLPGADGHAICRELRQAGARMAVIVLTSSDAEFDEVMALHLGADDYVAKPYRPAVLLARIRAALARRQDAGAQTVLARSGVRLDVAAGTLSHDGCTVDLTRNEQRILRLLMERAGRVVSRSELMRELWESDVYIDDNTLTANVTRVRRTLASLGVAEDFLQTRRGQGYMVR